jgi:hypothetical protein
MRDLRLACVLEDEIKRAAFLKFAFGPNFATVALHDIAPPILAQTPTQRLPERETLMFSFSYLAFLVVKI